MSSIINSALPILAPLAVYYSLPNPDPIVYPKTSVWRPPQWKQSAQTIVTIPVTSQAVTQYGYNSSLPYSDFNSEGGIDDLETTPIFTQNASSFAAFAPILYVFDAVLKVAHHNEIRLTENPVQTGAPITDHAMILPAHVTLEIGMSDAQDSFQQPSPWTTVKGAKSVSAFQQMLTLLQSRVPVTITTRLNTYSNMVMISENADDSYQTQYGLRAVLEFREVFFATVTAVSSGVNYGDGSGTQYSALAQATNSTPTGPVSSNTPSASVIQNNYVSTATAQAAGVPTTVPGAGNWSSVPTSQLSGLVAA